MNKERFRELDGLRGVAAFAVVLFHYTTRYDQLFSHTTPPSFFVPRGYLGVQLFFMISGFVIFLTLERTRGPLDFAVSRFSRLYPAYWTAVAITFSLLEVMPLRGRQVSPAAALVNLTMLQQWLNVPHVDGVYWTLTVELTFYALLLAMHQLGLLTRFVPTCVVWLAASATAQVPSLKEHVPGLVRNLFILDYAPLFIAGMCFYLRKTRGADWGRTLLLWGCAVALALFVEVRNLWVEWGFFAAFYAFCRWQLRVLVIPPLVFLGTISYSLYLLHQNLGYLVIRGLEARGASADVSVAAAVGASLSAASLVTFLVERPAMRTIRAWYRGHRAVGTAARAV